LFEGSKTVMRDFKGLVPDNVEDLLEIEGMYVGSISLYQLSKRVLMLSI